MIASLRALLLIWTATVLALAGTAEAAPQADPPLPVMKPGQFIWYEQPALVKASLGSEESVALIVSIAAQQAYVLRGGVLIAITSVSTGARGHETPVGDFAILEKKAFHRSNLYSNAPMPHMQRLTWSGIALHGGHLPGYPASHGCIRLPPAFARQLFALTRLGGTVRIVAALPELPGFRVPPPAPPPVLIADTQRLTGSRVAARAVAAPEVAATVPTEVADLQSLLAAERAAAAQRPAAEAARPPRSVHAVAAGPMLTAETRDLGGGAFDLVTLSGPPPADMLRPAGVFAPSRARLQPIGTGGR